MRWAVYLVIEENQTSEETKGKLVIGDRHRKDNGESNIHM